MDKDGAKSYGGGVLDFNHSFMSSDNDDDGSQLYQLNCDCEKEKTIPLIEVMAIGAKNNRIDLMHTINDIDSRMIYQKNSHEWGILGVLNHYQRQRVLC